MTFFDRRVDDREMISKICASARPGTRQAGRSAGPTTQPRHPTPVRLLGIPAFLQPLKPFCPFQTHLLTLINSIPPPHPYLSHPPFNFIRICSAITSIPFFKLPASFAAASSCTVSPSSDVYAQYSSCEVSNRSTRDQSGPRLIQRSLNTGPGSWPFVDRQNFRLLLIRYT